TSWEKIKTWYRNAPGFEPPKLGPTLGKNIVSSYFLPYSFKNVCCILAPASLPSPTHDPEFPSSSRKGKVSLPFPIFNFFDLGEQRCIRPVWHRYRDDCHFVLYVIDAQDVG
ncbi:hypothetical protein PAXINDRAFT_102995, partial [Paxillus involutus ATCC 200175]